MLKVWKEEEMGRKENEVGIEVKVKEGEPHRKKKVVRLLHALISMHKAIIQRKKSFA